MPLLILSQGRPSRASRGALASPMQGFSTNLFTFSVIRRRAPARFPLAFTLDDSVIRRVARGALARALNTPRAPGAHTFGDGLGSNSF